MNERIICSADEMVSIGAEFAATSKQGSTFGLVGTLGTGKTHWSKGFLSFVDPSAAVSSPTFSIVNEYRDGKHPVFHFDFYRLKSAEELVALGWDEYLDEGGILICEWANLFPELMPDETVWLEITHQADGSRLLNQIEKPSKPANGAYQ
jgi:tRNA threonylcarbamoyladenosine biosynthesis protein TsaE